MTDHAAEAQRILNDLHGTVSRAEATAAEMSASALLAIAHTLQAIHQTLTARQQPTAGACNAKRTTSLGPFPCQYQHGHTGGHRDIHGAVWTEGTPAEKTAAPCLATAVAGRAYRYDCQLHAGHAGDHETTNGVPWPRSGLCGAISQTNPSFTNADDFPCILGTGHAGPHTDREGDNW